MISKISYWLSAVCLTVVLSCNKSLDGPLPIHHPRGGDDVNSRPWLMAKANIMEPAISDKLGSPPRLHKPASICIQSYEELLALLGGNQLTIQRVILENGTTIPVGNNIVSMLYSIKPGATSSSLFQSNFQVNYLENGWVMSHFSEVWSLGCVYLQSAVPPFTNLSYKNQLISINTKFYWGVPPYNTSAMGIAWLVAE